MNALLLETNDEIRRRVHDSLVEKQIKKTSESKQDRQRSFFVHAFLSTLIFTMTLAIAFLWFYKQPPAPEIQIDVPAPTKPAADPLERRVRSLEAKQSDLHNRLWLSILAINENANMIRQNENMRYPNGGVPSDFVTFDENWKLSRMPRTMSLDSLPIEQQYVLKKNVKK